MKGEIYRFIDDKIVLSNPLTKKGGELMNWIWILLGLGLLFWMFKKGGCCGMGKKPMKGGEKEMEMENEAKDPVCGMAVNKDAAAATSEHMGKTFYFCAQACKEKFDAEPMKYIGKEEEGGMSGCH